MKTNLSLLTALLVSSSAMAGTCWERKSDSPLAVLQKLPKSVCVNDWRIAGTAHRGFVLALNGPQISGNFAMSVMNDKNGRYQLSSTIFMNNFYAGGECGAERQSYVMFNVVVDSEGKVLEQPKLVGTASASPNACEANTEDGQSYSFAEVL